MAPPEFGRDLLITLALVTEGVEALRDLNEELRRARGQGEESSEFSFNVVSKGLRELVDKVNRGVINQEEFTAAVLETVNSFNILESSLGGFGGLAGQELATANQALRSTQEEIARVEQQIQILNRSAKEVRGFKGSDLGEQEIDQLAGKFVGLARDIPGFENIEVDSENLTVTEDLLARINAALEERRGKVEQLTAAERRQRDVVDELIKRRDEAARRAIEATNNIARGVREGEGALDESVLSVDALTKSFQLMAREAPQAFRDTVLEMRRQQAVLSELRDALEGTAIFDAGSRNEREAVRQARLIEDAASLVPELGPVAFGDPESIARVDRLSKSLSGRLVPALRAAESALGPQGLERFLDDSITDMEFFGQASEQAAEARRRFNQALVEVRRQQADLVTPTAQEKLDGLKKNASSAAQAVNDLANKEGRAATATNELASATGNLGPRARKTGEDVRKLGRDIDKTSQDIGRRGARGGLLGGLRAALGGEGGRDQGFRQALGFSAGRLSLYALAAAAIFNLQRAIRAAVRDVVEFNTVLAEIQGVLPSRSEFEAFVIGEEAIQAALDFGFNLRETAESAKIFAQTGLDAAGVAESLTAALAAARGANLPIDQARDLIIAIRAITEGEVEALDILDRISRVESRRAVTATDLASALQKLGPIVRQLRGDMVGLVDEFDFALGTVATIVEQTRVSGDNAANSIKFVLSRLGRPDILRQLQLLSGVELARPGGRELRPAIEILQEMAVAFNNLIEAGRSAQAFDLATTLGGARQLQAVAALLSDFSTTIETARLSALAFNDAEERTAISLDTIQARLQRNVAAWGALGSAIGETNLFSLTIKATIDALTLTINTISQSIRALSDDFKELSGVNRFAIDFVDLTDVDPSRLERIKELTESANEANITVGALVDRIGQAARGISQDITTRFNASLQELIDLANAGDAPAGLRGLRQEVGIRLADALSDTVPELSQLTEALEDVQDPGRRAEIQAQRIAIAYELLGDAVFSTNAIFASGAQAIQENAIVVANELTTGLADFIRRAEEAAERELGSSSIAEDVRSRIRAGNLALIGDIQGALARANTEILRLTSAVPNELEPLVSVFFELEGAQLAFARSLQQSVDQTTGVLSLGAALDNFATGFLKDADRREQVISQLQQNILEILEADGLSQASLTISRPGQQALVIFNRLLSEAIENIRETTVLTEGTAAVLNELEQVTSNAFSTLTETLNTTEGGFVRVRQRLLEILTTLATTVDTSEQLNEVYRSIGISFDITTERFNAADTALQALVGISNELRKDIVLGEAELAAFSDALDKTTLSAEDAEEAQNLLNRVIQETGFEVPLAEEGSVKTDTLRKKVQELRAQLDALNQTGAFTNLFAGSEEGRELESILFSILNLSEQQIAEAVVGIELFITRTKEYLAEQARVLSTRERDIQLLEAQASRTQQIFNIEQERVNLQSQAQTQALTAQSQRLQQLLSLNLTSTEATREAIRLEEDLFNIEARRLNETANLRIQAVNAQLESTEQEILRRNEFVRSNEVEEQIEKARLDAALERKEVIDETALAQSRLNQEFRQAREDLLLENFVQAQIDLANQIQSNVDSATSGLRQVLTDLDAINTDFLANLLGPIGETFINRAAENFTRSLFDASADTFLGRISRAFGAGPEQIMRRTIDEAFALGGRTVGQEIIAASQIGSNFFAEEILAASGASTIPGLGRQGRRLLAILPEPEIEIAGANLAGLAEEVVRTARAEEEAGLQVTELINNFSTLASALGSAAIFGGGAGAQIGAQIGSSVGTVVGTELITILGGSIGGPLGALAGGLLGAGLGSLFGGEDNTQQEQLSSLNRIEENTRRSADVLELERRFNEIQRGAFNIPSGFNLPQFLPILGGQRTISQTNSLEATIIVQDASNPRAVVETIRQELGPMIQQELTTAGI